jgi:hypothetical protein
MKIRTYISENKWNLILILALLLTKSGLQLYDFPSSYGFWFLRIGIFLTAVILSLIMIRNWISKLITIGLIIIISLLQGQLNLWKVPTRKYAIELYKDNDIAINLILQQDSVRRIYKRPLDGLIVENLEYGIDSILLNDSERTLIESFIKNTDIIEIEKCEFGVLFIMRRFIDNGYGLFFVTQEQLERIEKKERFRINGYDVTGFSKIANGWYYLSFT